MPTNDSHHFVPQMYLRGFLDPEQVEKGQNVLWVYRPGMTPILKPTKTVAAETLFYQVELPGQEDSVERGLSRIETIAARHMAKLRAGDMNLTPEEKGEVATFISLSLTRTRVARDRGNAIAIELHRRLWEKVLAEPGKLEKSVADLEAQTGDRVEVSIESLRDYMRKVVGGEIEMTQDSKGWIIRHMFEQSDELSDVFERMRWQLLEAPPPLMFITSDNPVRTIDRVAAARGPKNFRFTTAMQFFFPISRQFELVGTFSHGRDERLLITPEWVEKFNQSQIAEAGREIYASFRSDDLHGLLERIFKERPSLIRDLPKDYKPFDD